MNGVAEYCRCRQTPDADVFAGHSAAFRLDDLIAEFAQSFQISLRGGMLVHCRVHRGRNQNRRACGENQSTQQIIGEAVREFGDEVGGCGRNQNHLGARG